MNKSNGVHWPTLVKTLQRIDDAIGPEPTTPAIARPYGRGALDPRFAVVPDRVAEVPPAPPTPSLLQAAPTLGVAARERVVLGPPAPAETLELADQLADHGGHDETEVAEFLRDAIAAAADPDQTVVTEVNPSALSPAARQLHRQVVIAEVLRPQPPSRRGWLPAFLRRPR